MKKILKTASNRLLPKRELISFVMRMTISIILFFTFIQSVWAQIPLSRTGNALRTGDILYKVKIAYVNVGEAGINKVWTLGCPDRLFLENLLEKMR